jgi:hypothetical protein
MSPVRHFRLVAVLLLCLLGVTSLPVTPVAAANCANIGPGAFLAGCDLSGMDLSGTNLSGANLRGANLEGADLSGANLSGANLSNARITEGTLDSANTAGANLRGIRWVAAPDVRTVTVSVIPVPGNSLYCGLRVDVTGFTPGIHELVIDSGAREITVGTDGTGTYDSLAQDNAGWVNGSTTVAMVAGVSSGPIDVAC